MAEVTKKVLSNDVLRKEPRRDSDLVASPEGNELQVQAGEVVNTGAKPSQDEVLPGRTFTWVWVEATGGQLPNLRKGYVSNGNLGPADASVPSGEVFTVFHEQVDKADFANACYLQATLTKTDPAYLYALAFALSGDQWGDTLVKTADAPDAPAVGAFRFTKEEWQSLLSEPEAANIQADDIKFPNVQCVIAAIIAAKSADPLESVITGGSIGNVDRFLAHLFAGDKDFGSNAMRTIRQAEADNNTQPSDAVIKAIYPDSGVLTAFFKRNADIFKEDGSATIEQALKACASKLNLGSAEVDKVAQEIEGDVFGISGPGVGNVASSPTGGGAPSGATVTGIKGGIDRRQFAKELENPAIVKKMADMVKGEVGWNAPLDTKIVQLETAFNRAMARGHSLAEALLSTSEAGKRGYYQGGRNGTYSRPVTTKQFADFKQTILPKLLAGSNRSEELLGFIATGNASPPTSTEQFRRGTRGGNLETGVPHHPESYFLEGPLRHPFVRLQGGESIPVPGEPSSSAPIAGPDGEPPEHMEGDIEGSGPSGGKFNVPKNTPIAPPSQRQTITLNNGEKVTVGKTVAEQFRGFFNDLVKLGAPVRGLGGFGVRGNPSEHPRGFAVDWAQHSRNVVDSDVRNWIDHNRDALKKLERRWGMSGGENWRNPDTGHFSIERILGEQHLKASAKASEKS